MPGPARTPLTVLRARGSRLAEGRSEPEPTGPIGACPSHLDAAEREAWESFRAQAETLGVLQSSDAAELELLAVEWARYRELSVMLKREGSAYAAAGGMMRTRPEVAQRDQAIKAVHQIAQQFGLTPSARTKASPVASSSTSSKSRYFAEPKPKERVS